MSRNDIEPILHNRKGLSGYSLCPHGSDWEITLNFKDDTVLFLANDLQEVAEKTTNAIQNNRRKSYE